MCIDAVHPRSHRYAADILALQDGLNFRSLLAVPVERSVYRVHRPDGVITLGLRTDQLTSRHLLALQGFRLAQYLKLGWICEDIIASRGMFCEPAHGGDDDLHMVTVSDSGDILGYLALVGNADAAGLALDDPCRSLFPVERAHDINLAEQITEPGVRSDQVRELKRFVHRRSMTDRRMRIRVTLELLLAAGNLVLNLPSTRFVVGDVEEHVALRHLVMVGLEVRLIEGTQPRLTAGDYLHPAYTKRGDVKPFLAEVPDRLAILRRIQRLEVALASSRPTELLGSMLATEAGAVERVAA